MAETTNLALPLVEAGQAQKHVTVNEALVRLDALAHLVLQSDGATEPPADPAEGACWGVGAGAGGAWAGQDGAVALFDNGGWLFLRPAAGWRATLAGRGTVVFDGTEWRAGGLARVPSGAGLMARTVEIDHFVAGGDSSTTVALIPAQSSVIGVTGRVLSRLEGGATSFRLGVAGADDRYGIGYGVETGSWLRGLTGSPQAYYEDTSLILSADGGGFAGGTVRLAVHLIELGLPAA